MCEKKHLKKFCLCPLLILDHEKQQPHHRLPLFVILPCLWMYFLCLSTRNNKNFLLQSVIIRVRCFFTLQAFLSTPLEHISINKCSTKEQGEKEVLFSITNLFKIYWYSANRFKSSFQQWISDAWWICSERCCYAFIYKSEEQLFCWWFYVHSDIWLRQWNFFFIKWGLQPYFSVVQ